MPTSWLRQLRKPRPHAQSAPAGTADARYTPPPRLDRPETESVSVQSVLAVVGAALVAIAAIVFTFFNPDLRDAGVRTLIIAIVTVLFLGSAALMARTRLRFSAEAVGALGGVFLAIDIYNFASQAFPGAPVWALAGIGTIVGAAALGAVGLLARIRTWLWLGIVGVTLAPAMFGYATAEIAEPGRPAGDAGDLGSWGPIVGHLGVGILALLIHSITPRLRTRFDGRLRADEGTATTLQLLVIPVVLVQLIAISGIDGTAQALGSTMVILVLAALAAVSTRHAIPTVWSILAGLLVVGAIAVLPLALTLENPSWLIVLVPLAAAIAVTGLAALPSMQTVRRTPLLVGAWAVLLLVAQAPAAVGLIAAIDSTEFASPGDVSDTASILGLLAIALGTAALWAFARRSPDTRVLARVALAAGLWIAGLTALDLMFWSRLLPAGQAAVGLGIALLLALALARLPRLQRAHLSARLPLIAVAHLLPIVAALIAAFDEAILVPVGIAALVVWVPVAFTLPRVVRPLHTTIGYAYALGLFTAALANAGVETDAVLCFVTSLGSIAALVATLTRRVEKRHWWAVLAVTSVPFLIGIASVIGERSGWTGVSTAVTFALGLTLVLTRRPGLTIVVRGLAAALLVPALAVVVISFGAEFLETSGSPVTLPIIAVIVAIVLPMVTRIEEALERHGITVMEARVVRFAIEASSLLTGTIAVLLALVRSAAGRRHNVRGAGDPGHRRRRDRAVRPPLLRLAALVHQLHGCALVLPVPQRRRRARAVRAAADPGRRAHRRDPRAPRPRAHHDGPRSGCSRSDSASPRCPPSDSSPSGDRMANSARPGGRPPCSWAQACCWSSPSPAPARRVGLPPPAAWCSPLSSSPW